MSIVKSNTNESILSTTSVPTTIDDIFKRARKIVPILREHSAEIENLRHLPKVIVDLLRSAGVFRAAMPKEWGDLK